MIKFDYTNMYYVKSSVVDSVFYNSHTDEVAISLKGQVYVYKGVPLAWIDDLVDPNYSAGRIYAKIQETYGPSKLLGGFNKIQFSQVSPTSFKFNDEGLTITSGKIPESRSFPMDVEYTIGDECYTYSAEAKSVSQIVTDIKTELIKFGVEIKIQKVVVHFDEE